jgi:hypothetical protein
LNNAPAKVILSDSLLFQTRAYSDYECYLLDDEENDNWDESDYFFTINHDSSYQPYSKSAAAIIVSALAKPAASVDMSTIANMK